MKRKRRLIKILVFEGPDKVGKSTLISEINRRTDYEYLCVDRFTGSAWVYDRLSKRRTRQAELTATEEELAGLKTTRIFNILLKCDKDILRRRILDSERQKKSRINMLKQAIDLYEEYARTVSVLPFIEIDTTERSIGSTVDEILGKVNKLCKA
jgi:thymidylate kinase